MTLRVEDAETNLAAVPADVAPPRDGILKAVREASEPSRVSWAMNALATVIACYGLFANSAAVVIGAMVVAMLLGPISGVALGLNHGDRMLLRQAAWSLGGGIVWILAIAGLIGLIHRDLPLTHEMLARTNPSLFDLIIALAGGAAGAVAVVSPRVGTAIVGVAVATALVPPLAAAGILLARGDFSLAGGALLLALTNAVAIQVAFSAVFWFGGYRWLTTIDEQGLPAFLRRNLPSLSVVGVLAVLLAFQFHDVVAKALFESRVRAVLQHRFDDDAVFHLVDVRFTKAGGATIVRAVVRGPKAPSATDVGAVQAGLPRPPDGSRLRLNVRFVAVVIMTPHGPSLDDVDLDDEGDER